MTLISLTLPDDPKALAGWLEQRLVAPDFGLFLAELAALNPETPRDRVPLSRLLGPALPVVLSHGLRHLSPDQLRQLLRRPSAVAALQELVLAEGGPFWDEAAARSDGLSDSFQRGRRSLDSLFVSPPPLPVLVPARSGVHQSWIRWPAVLGFAMAASLLIAVGILAYRLAQSDDPSGRPQANWGWAKRGGLPIDQKAPTAYLNRLADHAEEWFQERPTDAGALASRINDFRAGCSRLLHSPTSPLAPTDRNWLHDRCRAWAKKADEHQQSLDAGGDPAQVRAGMDDTMRGLVRALRERAGEIG